MIGFPGKSRTSGNSAHEDPGARRSGQSARNATNADRGQEEIYFMLLLNMRQRASGTPDFIVKG